MVVLVDTDRGVLGIISWRHTTKGGLTSRRYRARGVGVAYDKFYEWLNAQRLGREETDWPWHSWEFLDAKNDETIRTLWGEFFLEDDPDRVATEFNREELEALRSPEAKAMDEMIGQIFFEELQKEINKEIIAQMAKP